MTETSNAPMDCEAVRLELPALLYGELDGETKRRVESHVDSCEACAAESDAHRRTLAMLDEWSVERPPAPAGVRTASAPESRRYRWARSIAIGAAAASVAFIALSLVGARAERIDGQLVLSLGRRDARFTPTGPALRPAVFMPVVQAVARDEIEPRIEALLTVLDDELSLMTQREEARRVLLARAVDARRDSDRRRVWEALELLADRQEQLLTAVAYRGEDETPNDPNNRKEKP